MYFISTFTFPFGFFPSGSPHQISFRSDFHIWFGKDFTLDALPDTTLCFDQGMNETGTMRPWFWPLMATLGFFLIKTNAHNIMYF